MKPAQASALNSRRRRIIIWGASQLNHSFAYADPTVKKKRSWNLGRSGARQDNAVQFTLALFSSVSTLNCVSPVKVGAKNLSN